MKSVYTGDEKVAEFESYDELRVGDGKPAFIYEGNALVYPNPVKDGLVLWYDFSGRTNADSQRGIAEDLSGNGNHGTLQNFNYTPESGYDKNKLLFDGVDDGILQNITPSLEINEDITLESFLTFNQPHDLTDHYGWDWYIMCGNNQHVEEGFGLARESNGSLSFKYGGVNLITDYNPEPNTTHHLLAKFDGNKSELSFYLDGIRVSQSIRTDTKPQIPRRPLGIGYATYYSSPRAAVSIGSVKIYNRALTPEEIAHNYAIEKERFGIE